MQCIEGYREFNLVDENDSLLSPTLHIEDINYCPDDGITSTSEGPHPKIIKETFLKRLRRKKFCLHCDTFL